MIFIIIAGIFAAGIAFSIIICSAGSDQGKDDEEQMKFLREWNKKHNK